MLHGSICSENEGESAILLSTAKGAPVPAQTYPISPTLAMRVYGVHVRWPDARHLCFDRAVRRALGLTVVALPTACPGRPGGGGTGGTISIDLIFSAFENLALAPNLRFVTGNPRKRPHPPQEHDMVANANSVLLSMSHELPSAVLLPAAAASAAVPPQTTRPTGGLRPL